MTRCAGVKKAACLDECAWTTGKGCAKVTKKASATKKITHPKKEQSETNSASSVGLLTNKVIAFSGFRNDDLKSKIESLGGKVTSTITKKTNLVVYKSTTRNQEKLDNLTIQKVSLEKFLDKYSLSLIVKSKSTRKPKIVVSPLTHFKKMYGTELQNSDLPLPKDGDEYVWYKGTQLMGIRKMAEAVVQKYFAKQVRIRGVKRVLFYVPKIDMFVIVIRTGSSVEPRNRDLNDFYGIEFKYDEKAKVKITMDSNAITLAETYNGELPAVDMLKNIKEEYPDVIRLL